MKKILVGLLLFNSLALQAMDLDKLVDSDNKTLILRALGLSLKKNPLKCGKLTIHEGVSIYRENLFREYLAADDDFEYAFTYKPEGLELDISDDLEQPLITVTLEYKVNSVTPKMRYRTEYTTSADYKVVESTRTTLSKFYTIERNMGSLLNPIFVESEELELIAEKDCSR